MDVSAPNHAPAVAGADGVRDRPSRRLLRIGFCLATLTLLAAVAAIVDLRRAAGEAYRRDMTNIGVLLSEQTSRFMQAVDLVVAETRTRVALAPIAGADDFRRLMGTEEVHLFLKGQLKSLPQADALSIVGTDGTVVSFSRSYPVPPINVSDRDYFRHFRDNNDVGSFISEPVINRATGTWTFYLARRINGPEGRFLGIVLGAIEVRYLQDFYKAITLQEGAAVTLLRRDGTVLARYPDNETVIGKRVPDRSDWHQRVAANGGTYNAPGSVGGREHFVSVHPLKDYPLVVDVSITEHEALARWRQQVAYIAAAAAFAAIGFAVLFWALARQFRRLEDQAAELARGGDALREAKEEAESASQTKSQFLANMSHELRTPLNAIIAFSEIIRDQLVGSDPSRYSSYAGDIHAAGEHLLDLINDILDVSKIEVGRLELVEESFRISEVIDRCLKLVANRVDDGKIDLIQEGTAEQPWVWGDRRRLMQIVLNILSNAIKFTPAGGRVTVTSALTEAGELMIRIADTGIGIRREDIRTALTPFRQIDGGLSRRHGGTGLGLPLAKRLAEMHDGRLEIDSELARGTVVTVHLPASRVLKAGPALQTGAAAAGC